MDVKILEVRDRATFIPVLCVNVGGADNLGQRYLMRRVGFACSGFPNIIMTALTANGGPAWNDPYGWGGRTYPVAHHHIINQWAKLADGDVVDVEFLLGETHAPKQSERLSD